MINAPPHLVARVTSIAPVQFQLFIRKRKIIWRKKDFNADTRSSGFQEIKELFSEFDEKSKRQLNYCWDISVVDKNTCTNIKVNRVDAQFGFLSSVNFRIVCSTVPRCWCKFIFFFAQTFRLKTIPRRLEGNKAFTEWSDLIKNYVMASSGFHISAMPLVRAPRAICYRIYRDSDLFPTQDHALHTLPFALSDE